MFEKAHIIVRADGSHAIPATVYSEVEPTHTVLDLARRFAKPTISSQASHSSPPQSYHQKGSSRKGLCIEDFAMARYKLIADIYSSYDIHDTLVRLTRM